MTEQTLSGGQLSDGSRGFMMAMGAYGLWAILPFYLKALSHLPALEIVAHRVIWSVPVAIILLIFIGQFRTILDALRNPRMLAMAALTAALITINWSVYVWAVAHDQIIGAALGYYINPLFNVVLGGLFLGERLTKVQYVAVGFAFTAVLVLTFNAGGLPWVSLVLPVTFGLYGFFRKSLPMQPLQGFTLEVVILSVPALGYVLWLMSNGQDHFFSGTISNVSLLLLAGPFTAIPLILYAGGAKLLRYTTLGLMQYLTPTLLFIFAIFIFHEPFSNAQLVAFVLIWTGLIIYTWSSLSAHRKARASA
ncbi:EamA family transporter RarD [Brucella pituitosa]|uniref:EamA family transporter RarD n=1 Tax=Brucella pituitosa TaxID=571256 RepID=A0A643F6J0_9HYPH|nr:MULTISPECIES: EamA family transporter RarD [Brucella]PQZ46980.1 protein RarD [Ochrobactrum sp. MYb19]PRA54033.1 protein RarD [Ochrobactrum sp. MYb68]PRA61356.1 protein RarD [Ochrobactrum sp. MYb18]PRA76415.1 protein RarD [Brucella thiophenivorans]PRA86982.1 protein RarD [Ochrobactrum sp. MYb29]PRA91565.1 protein RarD [Ochrobactrum sp. MYb14]PRA98422.1 protein RarD [Ochrobactrum sp. MYb15]TCQ82549.1 chloramphenicol-sensitive protein RarD [Ochrobactrum sp. BH3]